MLRLNDAIFYHMVSSDSYDQRFEDFSLGLDPDDLRGSNSARQCQLSHNSTAYLFNLSIFNSQCLRDSFSFCVGPKVPPLRLRGDSKARPMQGPAQRLRRCYLLWGGNSRFSPRQGETAHIRPIPGVRKFFRLCFRE